MRRKEILTYLSKLEMDIIVLQETHLKDERDRAAAQKEWNSGPSFWSYKPDGTGGVAILVRWRSELKVQSWTVVSPGHLVIMDFLLQPGRGGGGSGPPPPAPKGGTPFRLAALYAPVKVEERRKLWVQLKDFTTDTCRPLLFAGDFNNRANPTDRTADGTRPLTPEEKYLRDYLQAKGMKDLALETKNKLEFHPIHSKPTYVANNPRVETEAGYTCYYHSGASRLDRVYAGPEWTTETCKLVLTPWSDHVQVYFTLATASRQQQQQQPDEQGSLTEKRWRLDPALLRQQEYVDLMETVIHEHLRVRKKGDQVQDAIKWWEQLKPQIGKKCRVMTGRVYRKELEQYHRAVARFVRAHANVNAGRPCDPERLRLDELTIQEFLKKKREQRIRREQCRTTGPLLDKGDWLNQRLGSRPQRRLDGLREESGKEPDWSTHGMLNIIGKYFQTLFAGTYIRQEDTERYVGNIKRKVDLDEEEEARLLQPVTVEEVQRAIGQGKEASAPGPDGLGYAFYQRFKDLLAEPLAEAFNTAMTHQGRFCREFFGGNLHLIYKDVGDPHSLQNWRPINISNVDYRIWARILNNRLAAIAHRLITEGQTSAVPGRRMAESLKTARQIVTMVRRAEWGGWMVNMDQSKAFDRVNRPYLWKVLEQKGIPRRFIHWLQLIYRDAHVTPRVNGQSGEAIDQYQGLRQGCPLSPLLYVIALDPLLERVQQDSRMLGVPMGDGQESDVKIVSIAHADDATFFLATSEEFQHLKRHTDEYAKASGAAINYNKSEVVRLLRGSRERYMKVTNLQHKQQEHPRRKGALMDEEKEKELQRKEHVRMLGIWYGLADGAWKHNWTLWKEKVMFQLKRWKKWHLTIYQRAQYVATYCLPGANFLSAIYPPPQKLVKEVEREMFQFILGTVHFPLNRAETYKRVEEGGLGVKALAAWLMSNFVSTNFRAWWDSTGRESTEGTRTGDGGREQTRVQAMWTAFGTNWANTRWATRWWWEEGRTQFRLTEALTASLPDYLAEAARHIQELKLLAVTCKQARGGGGGGSNKEDEVTRERAVRKELYEQAVVEALEQARKGRRLRASVISKYRLDEEVAKKVFTKSKDIPFSLWETRWRAFHQVFKVGATQPWLPAEKRTCQRCRTVWTNYESPEETIEHYVKGCPQANHLWKVLSQRLEWPELAAQNWETIVSGMEQPQQPLQQQHGTEIVKGPKGKLVPYALKRLTNLYALTAISLHKKKDVAAGRGQQTPAEPWGDYVLEKLCRSARWEKGNLKGKQQWHKKWGWMEQLYPPIT